VASDNLKKIVFITNLDVLGGTENNLISIVVHREFNNTFQSIIFSGTRPHKAIRARIEQSNAKIVQHNKFHGLRVPKLLRDPYFKKQVRNLHLDVVVFWNHVARFRQLDICKELGIKTVFFERGTGWREHDPLAMKGFLDSVDTVLSNSWAGKRMLTERWGFKGQCEVVPNALRPEIDTEKVVPKKFPEERPLRLGVASRLVAYKGVASAVLAMNELKKKGVEAELHIAGDGVESTSLQSLSQKLNVRTLFHGTLENMEWFYNHIDLLIVPSIREPFGTVAIEAQAKGCPVLASAVDGLPEVIQHNKTGWVVKPSWEIGKYLGYAAQKKDMPGLVFYPHLDRLDQPFALDPRDIANLVLWVVKNKHCYSQLSENAINFVQENFKFNEYIDRIIGLLSSTPTATAQTPSAIKDYSA